MYLRACRFTNRYQNSKYRAKHDAESAAFMPPCADCYAFHWQQLHNPSTSNVPPARELTHYDRILSSTGFTDSASSAY